MQYCIWKEIDANECHIVSILSTTVIPYTAKTSKLFFVLHFYFKVEMVGAKSLNHKLPMQKQLTNL